MVVLVKAIFWISFGDGSPRILSMCFVKNCVKNYLLCFPNFLMEKFLLVGTLISVSKHLPFFLSSAIIPVCFYCSISIHRNIPKSDGIISLNHWICMMFIPVVNCFGAISIWDFPVQVLSYTIMPSFVLIWGTHKISWD